MKKRYFIFGLAAILALPALAELTVDDAVSRDYLKYHGHSTAVINTTQKNIAQIAGEPLEEPLEYEYYGNPVVKFIRRVVMYLDPSVDDHSFYEHDIKTTPRFDDL